jgi:nucleoside-diphosphate-sugar epimerase
VGSEMCIRVRVGWSQRWGFAEGLSETIGWWKSNL